MKDKHLHSLSASNILLPLASVCVSIFVQIVRLVTFALSCFIQCTVQASSFSRCLFGSLLHPPPPHRHPALLLGAGCGSEDPTWEHWGLELRLSQSGWDRGIQSDGKRKRALIFLLFVCLFNVFNVNQNNLYCLKNSLYNNIFGML